MKPKFSIATLLVVTAIAALSTAFFFRPAHRVSPDDLALSVHFLDGLSSQENSGRIPEIRFLHYGCHLSLLLTNNADETVTFWKPNCPPGDMAIRLEFKTTVESKKIGIARKSHMYTGGMGIPKTFTLPPNDSLVYRIDLSSFWSFPFALDNGDGRDVYVRAVYESDSWQMDRSFMPSNSGDVWTGKLTTEWQKVRLSNVSGQSVGSNSATNLFGTVNQASNAR